MRRLRCHRNLETVVPNRELERHARLFCRAAADALAAPDDVALAIDHQLRRIDRAQVQRVGVLLLPCQRFRQLEAILPAQAVPVVDVEGQRNDAVLAGELADLRLGGWTGVAAFRGVELDHRGAGLRRGDARGQQQREAAAKPQAGPSRQGRFEHGGFEDNTVDALSLSLWPCGRLHGQRAPLYTTLPAHHRLSDTHVCHWPIPLVAPSCDNAANREPEGRLNMSKFELLVMSALVLAAVTACAAR